MSHSVYPILLQSVLFMICRGLCACTEMLWMCVLYVSFGSKVKPIIFGCVAMSSAVLFTLRSRLLFYSSWVWSEQSACCLSGFSVRLLCFVQALLYSCLCV